LKKILELQLDLAVIDEKKIKKADVFIFGNRKKEVKQE
jgi:hypothetical protein